MKQIEILLTALTILLCGFTIAIVMADWVSGCGETFHTAKGTVQGTCEGREFIKQIKGYL